MVQLATTLLIPAFIALQAVSSFAAALPPFWADTTVARRSNDLSPRAGSSQPGKQPKKEKEVGIRKTSSGKMQVTRTSVRPPPPPPPPASQAPPSQAASQAPPSQAASLHSSAYSAADPRAPALASSVGWGHHAGSVASGSVASGSAASHSTASHYPPGFHVSQYQTGHSDAVPPPHPFYGAQGGVYPNANPAYQVAYAPALSTIVSSQGRPSHGSTSRAASVASYATTVKPHDSVSQAGSRRH